MNSWSPVTAVTQLEACRRLLTSAYSQDAQGPVQVQESPTEDEMYLTDSGIDTDTSSDDGQLNL